MVGWEAEIQRNLQIPAVGSWRVKTYTVISSVCSASLVVYTKSFQIQVHRIKYPNLQWHVFLPDFNEIQQLEIRSFLLWFLNAIHVELSREPMWLRRRDSSSCWFFTFQISLPNGGHLPYIWARVSLGLGPQGLPGGVAGQGCGSTASYHLTGAGTASPGGAGGWNGFLVRVGVAPWESRQGQ